MQDEPTKSAIAVRKIHKRFGRQTVLNGIDLEIGQGEVVAILGRSGSGKSVLLKMMVGLQKPDSGSISVHGQEITELPIEELNQIRIRMGFLFQEAALYDSLSLEENVAFPLRRRDNMSVKEQNDRARSLLEVVGMEADRGKLPSEISGGMKKRVGLARALALEPDILLCDEPTAGLDPITATEIEELILKLRDEHEMACVVVTHDLHGARTVSDRLALIHEGNILVEGTYEELKGSSHPFVAQFLREGA